MSQIGFIGLGIMGRPMARNLLRKGHGLVVYDIDPAAMQVLVAEGARAATDPAAVGVACEVIVLSLPDAPQVRQVLCDEKGVLSTARPGTIVVDTSSISPAASREMEEQCRLRQVVMLDAPVSGGEPKAIDGTLAFMVGGRADAFAWVQPLLLAMGTSAIRVGGHGAGTMAKLANQVMVNLTIAAVAEAMTLAVRGGVDPGKVYEAVRGGLAGSEVLEAKMPLILARDFAPGGRIAINKKDLNNVFETARSLGLEMPLTTVLGGIFTWLENAQMMDLDHAAIARYYETTADVEIRGAPDASA